MADSDRGTGEPNPLRGASVGRYPQPRLGLDLEGPGSELAASRFKEGSFVLLYLRRSHDALFTFRGRSRNGGIFRSPRTSIPGHRWVGASSNSPVSTIGHSLCLFRTNAAASGLRPSHSIGLALFKVSAGAESRAEITEFVQIFRGHVVDVSRRTMTVELTGTSDKIDAFERMVRPHGLIEMARTGEVAVARSRADA